MENKFRAWDTENKLYRLIEEMVISKGNYIVAVDVEGCFNRLSVQHPKNLDGQIILERFTGYIDTGIDPYREVYEGDLYKIGQWIAVVEYNTLLLQFVVRIINSNVPTITQQIIPLHKRTDDWQYIGNIHENGDLLTGLNTL